MKKLIWGWGVINYTQVKYPIDGIMDVQMSVLSWISCITSAKVKGVNANVQSSGRGGKKEAKPVKIIGETSSMETADLYTK